MSARFRIRTKEGQELSFASHEIFAEFVRSGDLSPDDVVYDAETREWSSALTHPVVLQIQTAAEDAAAADAGRAQAESRVPGQDEPAAAVGTAEVETAPSADEQAPEAPPREEREEAAAEVSLADAIALDLAPAPAVLSPEQQAAAFVAKMEAERASELAMGEDLPGFRREKGAASVVEDLATPAREPRPQPQPLRRERARGREAPIAVPAPARRKKTPRTGWRHVPFVIFGVAAVAAGVYFGPLVLGPDAPEEGSASVPEATAEPPPPPPEIAATEEAVRARARERFLTSTQAALRGLQAVPDVWLRGSYLAAPSDHPRVREVWESYVTIIRDVRAGDEERYRQAYLRALDDARVVEGGARTLRLSGALSAFQRSAAARAAHYDRVEALALAAVRGHDALIEAEGTIMYQPATGPALSADPVIEAVGRSVESQALLNRVLDAILAELHAESGPGEGRNVRQWVWDGLLDAVTS